MRIPERCSTRHLTLPPERSPLLSLSDRQWEDVCDGCGRCCLVKLEDEDSGEIAYTNVACEYLNAETCRCRDYENRSGINPRCIVLTRHNLETLDAMPFSCAYRLLHEGREIDLSTESLKVRGKVVSERYVHDDQLPEHIVDWVSVTD